MKTIFKRLIVTGIGVFLIGGVSCNNTNTTDTFDLNKKVIAYTKANCCKEAISCTT